MTRIILLISVIANVCCYASEAPECLRLRDFKPIGKWLIMAAAHSKYQGSSNYVPNDVATQFKEIDALSYLHTVLEKGSIVAEGSNPQHVRLKGFLKILKKYNKSPELKPLRHLAIVRDWNSSEDDICEVSLYPVSRLIFKVVCAKDTYDPNLVESRKKLLLKFLEKAESSSFIYDAICKKDTGFCPSDLKEVLSSISQNLIKERLEKAKSKKKETKIQRVMSQKRLAIRLDSSSLPNSWVTLEGLS